LFFRNSNKPYIFKIKLIMYIVCNAHKYFVDINIFVAFHEKLNMYIHIYISVKKLVSFFADIEFFIV